MGSEDDFDEVRKMINRILSDAVQGKGHDAEPIVRGRAEGRSDERPIRRYIVQVPPDPGLDGPEVNASEESVFVTMDLRGVVPTAVRTRLAGRLLLVEVEGGRSVHRVVELPCDVEPEARWTVREGVLDLTLRRRASTR